MPIVWRCKSCGLVLHVEREKRSSYGVYSVDNIIYWYQRCPRCGRKLAKPSPADVAVDVEKPEA